MCAIKIDALLVRQIALTDHGYSKSSYCGLASDSVYPTLVSSVEWQIRCTEFSWTEMFRVELDVEVVEFDVEVEGDRRCSELTLKIGTAKPEAQKACLLYTSPSPRDRTRSRMPSSA